MSTRAFQLLLVAWLVAATLWAADDPFVGKWKLDPSKSKLIDYMKVESLGANKYALDLGGGDLETIVADGTDQPGIFGTTLSVTVEGPVTWKSSGRGRVARSLRGFGRFPKTGRRSAMHFRLTRLTGLRSAWIMCMNGHRPAQVSWARGKARAKTSTSLRASRSSPSGVKAFHLLSSLTARL